MPFSSTTATRVPAGTKTRSEVPALRGTELLAVGPTGTGAEVCGPSGCCAKVAGIKMPVAVNAAPAAINLAIAKQRLTLFLFMGTFLLFLVGCENLNRGCPKYDMHRRSDFAKIQKIDPD
jgi:hypothetical protein